MLVQANKKRLKKESETKKERSNQKSTRSIRNKRSHGHQGQSPYQGLHFTCVLHGLVY